MGTKVNSNYEDLITFTRASKGHALRPVSYGSELVTNGTFNSDVSGWSHNNSSGTSTFTVSGGEATFTRGAFGDTFYQSDVAPAVAGVYLLSFDITAISGGNLRYSFSPNSARNTANEESITAIGSYSTAFVSDGTLLDFVFDLNANGASVTIDNVSVKEVTFDQPDGTLTLFEHPENVPRVEWDSAGNRLGLLVEEQRTNLALNSNDLAADWSEQATTATLTQDAVGPDGKISAWTLVDDNSGGTANTVGINEIWTFASGGTYAISIFAKADGLNWIYFSNVLFDGGTDLNYFDLENVALGASNPNTCFIEDVGNGWRRCTQVMTTTTDLSGQIVIRVANSDGDITVDLDGTSSVQLYGFQVEAGSFPTSYMKNEGTASGAIRSADVASIPVADFGLNHSSYSMLLEAISLAPDNASGTGNNSNTIAQLKRGSTNYSSLGIGSTSTRTNRPSLASRNNAATILAAGDVASLDNTFDEGLLVKFSASFDVDSGTIAGSVNGSTVFSSTNIGRVAGVDLSFSDLEFRDGQGAVYIKSIQYYPRRLSNAQLVELTS